MIDPLITDTIRVGQLPPATFGLTDKIPHEIGEDLKQGTIQQLADTIGEYLGGVGGLAFNPNTVQDGGTLPVTTINEFMLVGKGTFHNVGGNPDIVTTEELNVVTSNGSFWSLAVEIPINVELAGITQNIRSGYLQTTPSEDAVFNALSDKLSLGGYVGTAQSIVDLITVATTKPDPVLFIAPITGGNQVFTLPVGFVVGSVLKSKAELFKTTEWSQFSNQLTIIVNTNINNSIYVKP